MSRFTFFLGLANLILSAFLLGACTESFWLVYALQALFIIGLRIRHSWSISKNTPTQPGMMLYYLDLCWIANFLLAFSFMAVLVEVLEERYLCHLSFVSSALCMTYIYVHLFFALAGLVFSLYLGSAWYDRMLTSHVTKKVRKHIAASTAKKD